MAETRFEIEVLPDGTIKVTTGKVGAVVHTNAEAFLKSIGQLAGGDVKRTARGDHSHAEGHRHHDADHTH